MNLVTFYAQLSFAASLKRSKQKNRSHTELEKTGFWRNLSQFSWRMSQGLKQTIKQNNHHEFANQPSKLNLESRPPIPGSECTDENSRSESRAVSKETLHMGQEATLKPSPSPWVGLPVKVSVITIFLIKTQLFSLDIKNCNWKKINWFSSNNNSTIFSFNQNSTIFSQLLLNYFPSPP